MNIVDLICRILIGAFGVFTAFRWFYMVVGLFARKKTFPETCKRFKYGVLICAHNEEKVIGALLDSIAGQDYPQDLLTVFVMCDNCTDRTREIAISKGAVAYTREDPDHKRKGYALEFLFSCIEEDFGSACFDGYFVFDADNLLDPHFITEMNKAFACGNKVVTGYRNSKNIETNVLSAGYGIHFFANTACYHRPRAALGLGTHLTGTGYLFAADLLENGWHFTNLTEDDEFTIYITSRAKKIAFCEDAEFFDEQPVDVGTAFRQRNRWARGRIVAFVKHFRELVKFPFSSGVGFTGYDIFWHYFPVGLATWVLGLIYPILSIIVSLVSTGTVDVLEIVKTVLAAIASTYAFGLVTGIIAVLRERKHIRCGGLKLFFYLLLSPWFLLADTVHNIVAVFVDVKWTKIDHIDDRKIDDLIPPKGGENNVH